MSVKAPRPYQEDAVRRVEEQVKRGVRRGIIHLFTGGGKSLIATNLLDRVFPPNKYRTVFFANQIDLIHQMYRNLKTDAPVLALDYTVNGTIYPGLGMVMGAHDQNAARIVVGSVQTLLDKENGDDEILRKPITKEDLLIDKHQRVQIHPQSKRSVLVSRRFDAVIAAGGVPDVIIFDEAHHAVATETLRMFQRVEQLRAAMGLPKLISIGLTATPIRPDGIGLHNAYDTMFFSRTYKYGQKHGYLVPLAPPIRVSVTTANDNKTSAANVENWTDIVVEAIKKHAPTRKILLFAGKMNGMSGVQAARSIRDALDDAGIEAAQTDGGGCIDWEGKAQKRDFRGQIYERFTKGTLQVICSYNVGYEGLDLPIADCLVVLRDTDNDVILTQMVGRILRPYPGKKDALIIEMTGNAITLVPIGTLFGFSVNLDDDAYTRSALDENEEDELMPADTDLRDMAPKGTVIGVDATYTLAEIISKMPNDWYQDDEDLMSLPINTETALLIAPPHYTYADRAQRVINTMVTRLTNQLPQEDFQILSGILDFCEWAEKMFGGFTLWHVGLDPNKTASYGELKVPTYVVDNPALEVLMGDAVEYAHRVEQTVVNAFMNKKQRWKSTPVTAAQTRILNTFKVEIEPGLSAGDASKLITHARASFPVQRLRELVEKQIDLYVKTLLEEEENDVLTV